MPLTREDSSAIHPDVQWYRSQHLPSHSDWLECPAGYDVAKITQEDEREDCSIQGLTDDEAETAGLLEALG